MNDGTDNCGIDTDYGADFPEDAGMGGDVPDIPQNLDNGASDSDGVSDTMGDNTCTVTGTESDEESIESDAVDNTENGVETTESIEDSYIDYISDLNHIDSLLYDIRTEIQEVKTVSGNSITVTFDTESMQTIAEVREKQDIVIEGQTVLCGLLGCVVFALCADFLVHSAKRIMKNMVGRKE